jgi:hypothetical protein
VPPRPTKALTATETTESLEKAAGLAARQHDVQEVVVSIQNKLLCAIRPDRIDADGQRDDAIKR